jgi:serine/threonine protein kinase
MSDEARRTSGVLPPDLTAQVESVCHSFEAAWQAGGRPPIEDYLRDATADTRGPLLRELLRIDLARRARLNEKPTLEEYRRRFPEDGELLWAVFRETPTTPDLSPAVTPGPAPGGGEPAVSGYEILGRLTPGGMGVVYRARQVALNRTVALKVMLGGAHAGSQERARFRVEAEAVASLSHPHIIPIYDYGEWNGLPYLAMEFAEGGSLAQRLVGLTMALPEAAGLVETLARAVHFVHERGIIHRDLKPANVLLTDQGVPKLADFGLAKRLDQDQGLTRTRAVLGTAGYMAPEQAAGDTHALGPAADVYALGAILYELLTGQPPFQAETYELTIHQVLSEEPPPPTRLRPDVPPELEAICLRCLEKEPARRFANALALADDLRRYQDGEPISTRPLDTFEWHARAARRAGYEILDVLGAGSWGIVYKARHLPLKRVVALTMIAGRTGGDPGRLPRLRAGAEAAAQLHHPNLVEVYDFGEHNGELYIATEYVEGASLADGLTGPLQPAELAAALTETLARAVHHAHQRGLIHGGLKPSRVLLAADGTCKIIGLSLAPVWRDEPSASCYMAPEQADPRPGAIGPATDVYVLGAMLYELLSGRPPILADTVGDMLEQVRSGTPEPPRHWRPEVPHGLESICLRCLEKEPARRYPSAAALAEDLRRFRSGEVLFVDDLDDWAEQQRWARRAGYEVLELLGRGGEGFSYKARQVATGRVVVLKRIAAQHRFVPGAKARFRWEAHLLAGLRHPNIVQVYDQGEQNDLAFFAREFVGGRSLAEQAAEAPFPAPVAAELTEALALAIQAAHGRGAVHGGLNPADVYLTPADVPKITRFRRARLPGGDADESRPPSETRRLAAYLAPEQLQPGSRRLVPATDIYALGAVLHTLLTGQPPFPGPTLPETLEQVRSQVPAPPSQWQPDVPPELDAVCLRCLEKQPSRRPASAEALANELRAFLSR